MRGWGEPGRRQTKFIGLGVAVQEGREEAAEKGLKRLLSKMRMAFQLQALVRQHRLHKPAEVQVDRVNIGAGGRAENGDASERGVDVVLRNVVAL